MRNNARPSISLAISDRTTARQAPRGMRSIFAALVLLVAACDAYQPCKPEANADSDGYEPTPCVLQQDYKDKGYDGEWFCDPGSSDGGQGTVLCTQNCSTHADCKPSPETGVNAVPRCDAGTCVLGCREGWTCPEGAGCEPNDLASVKAIGYWGRCSQIYSGPPAPEDGGVVDAAAPG